MEKLLDEISFEAPDLADKDVTIDDGYVDRTLLARSPRTKTCRGTSCEASARWLRSVWQPPRSRSVALVACGKKGPPLAPLRPVPGPVADRRRASRRQRGPASHSRSRPELDATRPASLDRIEVYAVTVAPDALVPRNSDLTSRRVPRRDDPDPSGRRRGRRRHRQARRSRAGEERRPASRSR